MTKNTQITTAYDLPFEIKTSAFPLLSSGKSVEVIATVGPKSNHKMLFDVFELFANFSCTGAMAGDLLQPWNSGLEFKNLTRAAHFVLSNCLIDERGILILAHLLLGIQKDIELKSLELFTKGNYPSQPLKYVQDEMSSYPPAFHNLPFELIDEDPEGGSYTFRAVYREPFRDNSAQYLDDCLRYWTRVIQCGGYGLSPIPPEESYIEPYENKITYFETISEWTAFKLRADPSCLKGLINIFAAFHQRCQEIITLEIV